MKISLQVNSMIASFASEIANEEDLSSDFLDNSKIDESGTMQSDKSTEEVPISTQLNKNSKSKREKTTTKKIIPPLTTGRKNWPLRNRNS